MFYEILKKLCDQRGTTIAAFAREAGFAKGSPSSWQKGSAPTATALIKISNYFGVSTDYLLGLDDVPSRRDKFDISMEEISLVNRLRNADPAVRKYTIASMTAILDVDDNTICREESLTIPILGLAAAGAPLFSPGDSTETTSVPVKFLGKSYKNHQFFAIEIRGNSMEPDIPEGSLVIVKADAKPESDDLALVAVESSGSDPEYMVKKVTFLPNKIQLISFNEDYPPRRVHLSKVVSLQKIVHVIRSA